MTTQSHLQDFDLSPVTPFAAAIEHLHPGASGREVAALLDNRISRYVGCHWKAGRRQAPKWALDILAAKIQARADESAAIADRLRAAPERPGLKAGAINLARWRARQT